MAASGTSSSVAMAMAASAFCTLCRPGRFSTTSSGGSAWPFSWRWTVKCIRPSTGRALTARIWASSASRSAPPAGDERQDLAHIRVIDAQHRDAIERQPLGELHERLLEPGEIVPVGVHVVRVDVGDDFHHREQVQERGVRLVRLGHDEIARCPAARWRRPSSAGRRSRRSGRARPRPAPTPRGSWWWSCRACRRWRRPASGASARPAVTARGTTGMRRARAASTSGLSLVTAVETTTALAPSTWPASWPWKTRTPSVASRRVAALLPTSEPETL